MTLSSTRRAFALGLALIFGLAAGPHPSALAASSSINASDLKAWLSVIASDDFEGRATFSEGLGLAASYIADELRSWKVKPGGDHGSYFQRVAVRGVKSTSHNTVTVTANGRSKTFKDGEGITLPENVGGKRSFSSDQIEFVGYGLNLPSLNHNDYAGRNVEGKVVVFLGPGGPKEAAGPENRRILSGRPRYATDVLKAVASIGPPLPSPFGRPAADPAAGPAPSAAGSPAAARPGEGTPGGFGNRIPVPAPDFTTVERLDKPIPPAVSARDEFFEFLFSGATVSYAELRAKVENQEALPGVSLKGVSITFNIDTDYEIVRTQFTRNVVGIVEGADPKLKDTYVAYGAHYDHVGYAEGEVVQTRTDPAGRVRPAGSRRAPWRTGSGTGRTTTARGRSPCSPWPRPSPPVRKPGAPSSSSGTAGRSAASGAPATSPIIPRCRSTRWWPSSIRTWSAATTRMIPVKATPSISWAPTGSAPNSTTSARRPTLVRPRR